MLMLVLAVKAAAHRCKGFGERKDFTADEQIAVLRADRVPEHAICRDRHLGHQIRPCQRNALRGDASQRDAPYHPNQFRDLPHPDDGSGEAEELALVGPPADGALR